MEMLVRSAVTEDVGEEDEGAHDVALGDGLEEGERGRQERGGGGGGGGGGGRGFEGEVGEVIFGRRWRISSRGAQRERDMMEKEREEKTTPQGCNWKERGRWTRHTSSRLKQMTRASEGSTVTHNNTLIRGTYVSSHRGCLSKSWAVDVKNDDVVVLMG